MLDPSAINWPAESRLAPSADRAASAVLLKLVIWPALRAAISTPFRPAALLARLASWALAKPATALVPRLAIWADVSTAVALLARLSTAPALSAPILVPNPSAWPGLIAPLAAGVIAASALVPSRSK